MAEAGALDAVLTLDARQLGVMQPRPLATLHVGGPAIFDGQITTGTLSVTGNATVGGTLTVTGASSFGGRAVFTGDTALAIGTATPNSGGLEVQAVGGGAAKISFHRPGAYAAYFGLDTNNIWKVGGWSMGAVAYRLILGDGFSNGGSLVMAGHVTAGGGYLHTTDGSNGIVQSDAGDLYVRGASGSVRIDGANGIYCTGVNRGSQFVAATAGYSYQLVDTQTSFYWDRSTLAQWNTLGNVWRFYNNTNYFDFTINSPAAGMVTFGGTANKLVATQFIITGSNYAYLAIGRSASEIGANVHLYSGGNIYAVGDVSGATITNRSTEREKIGIMPVSPDEGLARVLDTRMSPITFTRAWPYNVDPQVKTLPPDSLRPATNQIGFTAEQMAQVVPEATSYNTSTGMPEGVMYQNLTALLWAAMRKLDERIGALENG